jgi:hypothetical protein
MTGQGRHADASDQGSPHVLAHAATECDLAGLVCDIQKLGLRLRSPDILGDPRVKAALDQLGRQVAGALGPGRGRHRLPATRPEPARDIWGFNLKPDPLTATTSAEFIDALRHYRAWAGNTPFRQMAARAHQAVAHSTMWVALNSSDLPALKVVVAIVVGCGGDAGDQGKFVAAWRRVNSGNVGSRGAP